MSGLVGGGTTIANAETPLSGLQIQSSAYGLALAFGYGRTRVSPNLIWYGDFVAVPHTSSQSQGGKGGGGVTTTNTTYTYTAALALALGETVSAINRVWIDKAAPAAVGSLFTSFLGPDPQTPWSYLTGAHPTQALGYSGIAYVAAAGYDLGNRSILPNHTFDVTLKLPLGGGVDDADPGQILPDLLTNTQYGVTNFPVARIGDLSAYSAYCRAAGLLLSPLYDKPAAASAIITSLMQLTNSGVFFSEGVLKVTPYGDAAVSGNGASYTPDLTTKADFTEDDFLVSGSEDPVRVKRNAIPETVSGSADAYNQVTLEILDRSQDYRPVPVVAQDMVSIDAIGLRPMAALTAHEIADPAVGQAVANLILQRVLNIRATYEWSAGWQWCRLEPTDIVSLTEPALGMDGYPVRILKIEEDGDTGGLKFSAEDVPFGIGHHVTAPLPILGGYAVDQAIAPGPTNAPVIFEPPNSLTAPDLQLWVAASGGVNWGGCEVWASDDGASYRRVGIITNPARHGTLTALLSAGSDPDTTHTLAVELGACRGQLLPGTTADADAGNTLLWVDGELLAYASATLTGSHAYSLGYLHRGIKGTANATHASGNNFVHIDDALFRYTIDRTRIGAPIWLKFPAFNTLGFALQTLASVSAYQYTFAGNRPLHLTALTAVGGMFQVSLSWGFAAGQIDRDYTEIWGATSNNLTAAMLLSSVKSPAAAWTHPGLQPGQTWYYWARVVDTSGNTSDFFPSSATGGIAAAPSADPSALLTQLKNSIGMGQLAAELAAPITMMPGSDNANAIGSLQSTLSDWDITNRMQFQEAVTNATISIDPATGQIQLLATANITTNVESRLTAVEVTANADHGTLTSTVATVATDHDNLTTAQGQITLLAGEVALSASQVYVDSSVAGATGALTVKAANEASALAVAEIQSALDAFTQGTSLTAMTANVATAQEQLKSTSDALASEVVSRTALVATVAANGAAILTEESVRANGDSSNASSISTVQARLDSGDFSAVQVSATASASLITGLEAQYVVKVDANGHVAGIQLASGAGGASIAMLADKFLWLLPDGLGGFTPPKQVLMLYNINGTPVLGLDGTLIVDGGVVARMLAVDSVTAGAIKSKEITADKLAAKTITAASGVIDDLAVDTLQIAGNAVTFPKSASTVAVQTCTTLTWTTLQTVVAPNLTGAPVHLIATSIVNASTVHRSIGMRLLRNGTEVANFDIGNSSGYGTTYAVQGLDETPPAGATTYTLQIYYDKNGSANDMNARSRAILMLEVKR